MNEGCTLSTCSFAQSVGDGLSALSQAMGESATNVALVAPWFWPMTAGIAGAIIASFVGVVVDRLPRMHGWHGRPEHGLSLASPPSHCDHCGSRLDPISLLPVAGWLIRKGRCASCGHAVPAVYPIVEAGTALASAAIIAGAGPTATGLLGCLCLWVLVLASWMDWSSHEIPDAITVPFFFAGLILSPLDPSALSRAIGAALAAGFVWLAFRLTGAVKGVDAMSYGDVALVAALGAWCGLCSVPYLLLASVGAYLVYAIPLRHRGTTWVPMGPALSIGFATIALFGLRIA